MELFRALSHRNFRLFFLGQGRQGGRGMISSKLIITQSGDQMAIERFNTRRNGEEGSRTDSLTLDGKARTSSSENRTRTASARWTARA